MISGARPARLLSAIVLLGSTVLGTTGVLATPAFAAPRSGAVSPNGAGVSIQFTAGGQTGTVAVQGLAGQQLTVTTSAGTFAANCGLQLSLLTPTGTTLTGPQCAGQTGSVSSASLPSNGMYKASLVAGTGATGTVTVAATSGGTVQSITTGAAALPVAISTANQDVRLGFTGQVGTNYIATTSAGTLPDCDLSLRILDSTGNPASSSVDACAGSSGFADARITKKTKYSVQLLHNGTVESGTVSVTLTAVADSVSPITLDGSPTPVSVSTPGQNAEFTFSGTSGQRVAAQLTGSTFAAGCPAVALSLLRPDGTQLGNPATTCTDNVFLDTQALDQSGTWTLLVDPQGPGTGSATLQAYTSVDQSGTIIRNGTPVNVNLPTPGQNAALTFTGSVGQVVSAEITNSAFAPGCPEVVLAFVRPDGSQDTSVNTCTDTAFLDAVTIDQAGTWTVLVDPQGAATGTATLQAFNANDQMGLIHLDGTPVSVSVTSPGQDSSWHFDGTTGQSISASVTSATFPGCSAFLLRLVRPDGTDLGSVASCNDTAALNGLLLDQTGTWNIVVDPQGTATGTATLSATATTDQVHAITVGGAPVNVNLATPGQNGNFTFTGTTGDEVSYQVTNSTFAGCTAYVISLVRPDSSTLGTPTNGCGTSLFVDAQTLDQTGTWTIHFDPQGTNTGTAKLQAYNAADQVKPISLNGPAVKISLTQPGKNATLTFTGSVGQGVSAQVTAATFTTGCPAYSMYLVRPDGSQFGNVANSCTDSLLLDAQSLDQSGTWSIVVDPQGTNTGTAMVQAFEDADQILPITLNGAPVGVNLGPGQQGFYTFTGAVGQKISAQVTNSTFPGCTAFELALIRPDDSQLGNSINGCNASAFLDATTLDQNGTWSFNIQPSDGAGGSASLQAYTFTDQTGPVADLLGKDLKLLFVKPGQNALITFSGTTGQHISAFVSSSTVTGCPAFTLSLVRPNGSTLAGPVSTCTDNAFIDATTLDATGTWTILVDPQGPGTGQANLQAYSIVEVPHALQPNGPFKSFTTTVRGLNQRFHFTGQVGDSRTVTISGSTFNGYGCPGLVVSFLRPNGTVLSTTSTCTKDLVLGPSTLDVAGTWTVLVDPQGPATGTLIIKLT